MFAVFGICLVKARAKAEKTVKGQEEKRAAAAKKAKLQNFKPLTPEQFEDRVNSELERLVNSSAPARISPEYNVPAAAEHFCQIAKKQPFANLMVFIKAPEQTRDKKGRAKVVGRYVPFVPGKDYSLTGVAQ